MNGSEEQPSPLRLRIVMSRLKREIRHDNLTRAEQKPKRQDDSENHPIVAEKKFCYNETSGGK